MTTPRMTKQSIRVMIGFRLYELFCPECHTALTSEDENLQQLECDNCHKMYGYRLHPEVEQACFELTTTEIQLQ